MHVLFVHQNFPAQFGHVARRLCTIPGWRCTFVTQVAAARDEQLEVIRYKLTGGARANTNFCSRTFENAVWHSEAAYRALLARPDIRPDLIVGHSGFVSTLPLRELYPTVPQVNFFEYFYHPHGPQSDMTFRTDLPWQVTPIEFTRARFRNAGLLLDLQNCDAAYSPTRFQQSLIPPEFQAKIRVIFDGIDRQLYHGFDERLRPPPTQRAARKIAGVTVPPDTRVVTYVSRGFESMRGFDIFMRTAKRIALRYPNVLFLVVGNDRICYGGDDTHLNGKTFKQWVLESDEFDLSKFVFTGALPPPALARLLALSDLHIYLTVPFVLSWSMMDAMSCGAVVLASATAPVQEMIRDGENGLLVDFFDMDGFVDKAVRVLEDPAAFRPLGRAAEEMIATHYSLDAVLPEMVRMYEETVTRHGTACPPPVTTRGNPPCR